MKHHGCIILSRLLLAAIAASQCMVTECGATVPTISASSVDPVIQMDGPRVRVCGVRALFGAAGDRISISFLLERHVTIAEFKARADPASDTIGVTDMRIIRRSGAPFNFAASPLRDSTGFELRMPANDSTVGQFIQELMVQGTDIEIEARDWAEPHRFEIHGPLSQSTRASYLNCAGDLYLPGE